MSTLSPDAIPHVTEAVTQWLNKEGWYQNNALKRHLTLLDEHEKTETFLMVEVPGIFLILIAFIGLGLMVSSLQPSLMPGFVFVGMIAIFASWLTANAKLGHARHIEARLNDSKSGLPDHFSVKNYQIIRTKSEQALRVLVDVLHQNWSNTQIVFIQEILSVGDVLLNRDRLSPDAKYFIAAFLVKVNIEDTDPEAAINQLIAERFSMTERRYEAAS